jgi:hypothetical protein
MDYSMRADFPIPDISEISKLPESEGFEEGEGSDLNWYMGTLISEAESPDSMSRRWRGIK